MSGVSESGQQVSIRNGDIELRFQLRDDISEDLSKSIGEHGILVPPIILKLTNELKRKFKTDKPYICIDGHSRLGELPEDAIVQCSVLTWDQIVIDAEKILKQMGIDASKFSEDEIVQTYILRLHACREPLPRKAYIKVAEELRGKNLSLRQIASMIGIAKSTLHDWLKKEPVEDEDWEAQRRGRKQCGFCGDWIKKGAQRIWFHSECHDKVVTLIERFKAEGNEALVRKRTASQVKGEGGENGE
jgi:predicted transcriptional regulator